MSAADNAATSANPESRRGAPESTGRYPQGPATAGSQKWLQLMVNDCPELLNAIVAPGLGVAPAAIQWRSPLRADEYAEYRDDGFLRLLDLRLPQRGLVGDFWPERGPQWDALGLTDGGGIILVEAKAYIGEMRSGPSGAGGISSRRIEASLRETQRFLGADAGASWADSEFYQYANRLAHLYLLAQLNGLDAWLVMLYFRNDVAMGGPERIRHWEEAIAAEHAALGLPQQHPLAGRVAHLYPNVRDLPPALLRAPG